MTDVVTEEMRFSSKIAGAEIRGLPPSSVIRPRGVFRYTNYLERQYVDDVKNINRVVFDIRRYREYQHELTFDNPVSEKEAIEAVEKYLSKPLKEVYYNNIRKDLFHEAPWHEAKTIFFCRGDCLTDAVFLEETTIEENGLLTFFIGS